MLHDGSPDPSFPDIGLPSGASAIAYDPDTGGLFVGSRNKIRFFNKDGKEERFFTENVPLKGEIKQLAYSNGHLYILGSLTHLVSGELLPQIVRLEADMNSQPIPRIISQPQDTTIPNQQTARLFVDAISLN
ncbi:MAG: hypothetical protein ACKVHP_04580, partial [Verrucomicrobiales bacterium]